MRRSDPRLRQNLPRRCSTPRPRPRWQAAAQRPMERPLCPAAPRPPRRMSRPRPRARLKPAARRCGPAPALGSQVLEAMFPRRALTEIRRSAPVHSRIQARPGIRIRRRIRARQPSALRRSHRHARSRVRLRIRIQVLTPIRVPRMGPDSIPIQVRTRGALHARGRRRRVIPTKIPSRFLSRRRWCWWESVRAARSSDTCGHAGPRGTDPRTTM